MYTLYDAENLTLRVRYKLFLTRRVLDERAIDLLLSREIGSRCAQSRAEIVRHSPMKKLLNERKLAAVHTPRLPHARTHARTHIQARTYAVRTHERHVRIYACVLASSIYFKVKRFPFTHYDPTPCRLASYLSNYPMRCYHYQTREPKRTSMCQRREKNCFLSCRWVSGMKKLPLFRFYVTFKEIKVTDIFFVLYKSNCTLSFDFCYTIK